MMLISSSIKFQIILRGFQHLPSTYRSNVNPWSQIWLKVCGNHARGSRKTLTLQIRPTYLNLTTQVFNGYAYYKQHCFQRSIIKPKNPSPMCEFIIFAHIPFFLLTPKCLGGSTSYQRCPIKFDSMAYFKLQLQQLDNYGRPLK